MTDIATWLEQLGLAKCAPIFSENEVKLADLSELSEDDLKEIGLPLGPRRRILKAVRALLGLGFGHAASASWAAKLAGASTKSRNCSGSASSRA